jgi:hypothetical protein
MPLSPIAARPGERLALATTTARFAPFFVIRAITSSQGFRLASLQLSSSSISDARLGRSSGTETAVEREASMLDLLEQQKSLTINHDEHHC